MQFILLVIGVVLIILNALAIKKDKGSFASNLNDAKDNIQEFNIEIGKLRKEIGETVLDIQKDMEKMNNSIKEMQKYIKINETRENNSKIHIENNKQMGHNYTKEKNKKFNENLNKDINLIKNPCRHKENFNKSSLISKDIKLNKDNNSESIEKNNEKIDEVKKFINLGMSVDEISEKMDIGKGEVLLIKELYLK